MDTLQPNDAAFSPSISLIDSAAHSSGITKNSPAGEAVDYLSVLRDISAGEHAAMVQMIREAQAAADEETHKRLKARMPGYMTSGVFPPGWRPRGEKNRTYRTLTDCTEHAGVVAFDSDKFTDLDAMEAEIERVTRLPEVYYAVRSVSGNGYHTGVRIDAPEGIDLRNPPLHRAAWEYTDNWLNAQAARNVAQSDTSSKNVNRFHFASHDARAYINERPAILRIPESAFKEARKRAEKKPGARKLDEGHLALILEAAEYLPVYEGSDEVALYEGTVFALAQCDRMLGNGEDADDYPLALAYANRHKPSQRNADNRRPDRAPACDDPALTVNGLLKKARENGWEDPRGASSPLGEMPQAGWATLTDMDDALRLIAVRGANLAIAFDPNGNELDMFVATSNGTLSRGEAYIRAELALTAQAYAAQIWDADLDEKEFAACMNWARRLKNAGAWERIRKVLGGVLIPPSRDISEARRNWERAGLTVEKPERFDAPGVFIGTPDGVLNLNTCELLAPEEGRERLITLSTDGRYRASLTAAQLEAYADKLFPYLKDDRRGYFIKAAAWSMRGMPSGRFYSVVGESQSGKSTILEGIGAALGEYGEAIVPSSLDASARATSSGLTPELLWTHRARFAYTSDLRPRMYLHRQNTKNISAGDAIPARDLHEKFGRTRRSVSTMFLSANYGEEPIVERADDGLQNRYRQLQYAGLPPAERIAGFRQTLESSEYQDAIVTMLARAGRELTKPPGDIPKVKQATEDARASVISEDALDFITERLKRTDDADDFLTIKELTTAALAESNRDKTKESDLIFGYKHQTFIGHVRNEHRLPTATKRRIDGKRPRGWAGMILLSEPDNAPEPPPDFDAPPESPEPPPDFDAPDFDAPPDNLDWRNAAGWAQEWGCSPAAARTRCEREVTRGTMLQQGEGMMAKWAAKPEPPSPPEPRERTAEPPPDYSANRNPSFDMGESLPANAVSYDLPPAPERGTDYALDLETTGLSPITDAIVAVLVHTDGTTYIRRPDAPTADYIRALLGTDGARVITQNGYAFDMPFIERWLGGASVRANLLDTTVMAGVVEPSARTSIEKLTERWLGETIEKDRSVTRGGFVWQADAARMRRDQERYCHDDVRLLAPLADAIQAAIDESGQTLRARLEQEIHPSITALHGAIMPIDGAAVDAELERAKVERDDHLIELGRSGLKNPNAPASVKAWLGERGVQVDDASETTLANVPAAASVLAYRKAAKSAKTLTALKAANDREGGFRGAYRQAGSDTARFTGRGIDLGEGKQQPQNLPRGIRHMFSSNDGWLVTADLSGVELRIHAALNDSEMAQAFRDGRDLHDESHQRAKLPSRTKAKNFNFNLIFGGGVSGLARAGIAATQAEIAAWRRAWPESAAAIDRARALADSDMDELVLRGAFGYMRTLHRKGGRFNASQILNTPVQSIAALGMKVALVELQRRGLHANLLMTLHDEIVLGEFAGEPEAQAAAGELVAAMQAGVEKALASVNPPNDVPIEVEVNVAQAWDKP